MTITASPAPPTTRTSWSVRITLTIVGILTMTPALVLVNPSQLEGYGVDSPDLIVLTLLQHRGVLQLALGAAIVWAAFDRRVRAPILLGATVTKGTGVVLTMTRPDVFATAPGSIGLWFDVVCLALLPAIAIATLRRRAAVTR